MEKKLEELMEYVPYTVYLGFWISTILFIIGLSFVAYYLLFISFFVMTICVIKPINENLALKIRAWGIKKYPNEYRDHCMKKRLRDERKKNYEIDKKLGNKL